MSTNTSTPQESCEQSTNSARDDVVVADTGAGMLVYRTETEHRSHLGREVETARELLGFADVDDWAVIRDALRARGHGVGATTTLPEFPVTADGTIDTEAEAR